MLARSALQFVFFFGVATAAERPMCLVPYGQLTFRTPAAVDAQIDLLPRYGVEQKTIGGGSHAGVTLGRLPADFAKVLNVPKGLEWVEGGEVAIKAPYRHFRDGPARIASEADMMAKVAPHDPTGLFVRGALDEEGGVLVMERRAGFVPLDSLPNPIPQATREEVSRQLESALQVLYRAKVVHSDLKPDNILIDPKTNRILIIDFSVAAPAGGFPAFAGKKRETGNGDWHSTASRQNTAAATADDAYTVGRVRRWMERRF